MNILTHIISNILRVIPEMNKFPFWFLTSSKKPGQNLIMCVLHMARVSNWCDWWKREREREWWMNRGDWLRADRLGGETESRWQSWHLSYTKICLELFSTCLKKEPILHVMPNKRHSQVLTLCDHAFPKLFDHNRKPPLKGMRYKTLSNPSTLSHPRHVSKQRGHSEQERVSLKH